MKTKLNRLSLIALVMGAGFFASCSKDEEKVEPSKKVVAEKKKEVAPTTTVSDQEMAARGQLYNNIPKSVILKVELNDKGEEIPESAKMFLGKEELNSSDAGEIEKAIAVSAEPEHVINESELDSLDAASDASTDSFRLIPWALRRPPFRWGYRQGYRAGSQYGNLGTPRQAYYTGLGRRARQSYYNSCGNQGAGCYYNGYMPQAYYGGYNVHYGPRSVCNQGNARYYTYAAQGSSYYQSQTYQSNVGQFSYNDPYGYYGADGFYTNSAYNSTSSYNNWNVGTVNPYGVQYGPAYGNDIYDAD